MCIKCLIGALALKEAGLEKIKTVVGTVNKEALKELSELDSAEIKLRNQIEEDVKALKDSGKTAEETIAEIKPKYETKWNALSQLKKEVMEYVFKDAGIETPVETLMDQGVSVNKLTGEVSTSIIQPIPEYDVAPGVH